MSTSVSSNAATEKNKMPLDTIVDASRSSQTLPELSDTAKSSTKDSISDTDMHTVKTDNTHCEADRSVELASSTEKMSDTEVKNADEDDPELTQ